MLLNYQSSNLCQSRKNLMDFNMQIHVGSHSKCEAKRRWKKWSLSVDLTSISSTLITEDLSPMWKLTNQNYIFRLQPHLKIEPMSMIRDGNGVWPKDGVFASASHSFVLPYSHPALHDRKNFLTSFPPLRALRSPASLHRTLLFVNLPHSYYNIF